MPDFDFDRDDTGPPAQLFLQRRPYRRRRLIDAMRVLPIFALFLLLVPALLIPKGLAGSTSEMALFLFSVWLGIIAASAIVVRLLSRTESRTTSALEDADR